MNQLAQQLDEKLRTLDPVRARDLESRVRDAIEQAEQNVADRQQRGWPDGYFDQTAGALEGQPFQRPPQGEMPSRDDW
jgi:hypothetical protein